MGRVTTWESRPDQKRPLRTQHPTLWGWNLVGFHSFETSYSVAKLKSETRATRVEGYDFTPPYHLRVLGDGGVLQSGYGYWVRVESAVDWIVEVSQPNMKEDITCFT